MRSGRKPHCNRSRQGSRRRFPRSIGYEWDVDTETDSVGRTGAALNDTLKRFKVRVGYTFGSCTARISLTLYRASSGALVLGRWHRCSGRGMDCVLQSSDRHSHRHQN